MTDLDLEAIKARAEEAGGIPWSHQGDVVIGELGAVVAPVLASRPFDLAHIASMDPKTTLALVAEVERLRMQVDLAYEVGKLVERGEIFEIEDNTNE